MKLQKLKNLDIIGPTPSLKIFKTDNYKSFTGSILSIIISILIIAFFIISFIDFFKFGNPTIVYWKDNTQEKNITINLYDKLFLFQIANSFTNKVIKNEDIELKAIFTFQTTNTSLKKIIRLEQCKLGDNINMKHKNSLEKIKLSKNASIDDFLCFKKEDINITLYNDKKMGEAFITLIVNSYNEFIFPNEIYIKYYIGIDSINHFDRNQPFSPNYIYGETLNFDYYTLITKLIEIDYVEYETDNGLFFPTKKIYEGIDLKNEFDKLLTNYYNYFEGINLNGFSLMGWINIRINEKSYERYKRTYPRLQSLVADSISTIQLFFMVYYFFGNYYYNIGMNIEIMKNILDKKNKNIFDKKNKILIIKNNNFTFDKKSHYKNQEEIINIETIQRVNTTKNNINSHTKNIIGQNIIGQSEDRNFNNKRNKNKELNIDLGIRLEDINKINFLDYLFFCCTKKRKLIKKCQEIVEREASIDNIIYKLLKIENHYMNT